MHQMSIDREYSRSQIKAAGKLLEAQKIQRSEEIEDAFRVAHNWRLHHAYPMVRERARLTRLVKPLIGITAGRLKRMFSIRKKLFRGSTNLGEMQDLVGCRAILPDMDRVQEVWAKYPMIADGGRVKRVNNYIEQPKPSGYRSLHLVLRFNGGGIGKKTQRLRR